MTNSFALTAANKPSLSKLVLSGHQILFHQDNSFFNLYFTRLAPPCLHRPTLLQASIPYRMPGPLYSRLLQQTRWYRQKACRNFCYSPRQLYLDKKHFSLLLNLDSSFSKLKSDETAPVHLPGFITLTNNL